MDWTPFTVSGVHGAIISFQEVTNPNHRLPGTGPGAIHDRPTVSVRVAVMRRRPPLPPSGLLHANEKRQSRTHQISGYLQLSLLQFLGLLLWLLSVTVVWRDQRTIPLRYARRHRLRGGKARRPAFMAHGSRLRALHPAALVTPRHRNVADGYYCEPYLLLLLARCCPSYIHRPSYFLRCTSYEYSCTSNFTLPFSYTIQLYEHICTTAAAATARMDLAY